MKAPGNGAHAVVKAQGSIAGFLFFLSFCHSSKIFSDHFVTARVDFEIACSIKFLSSSVLVGFLRAGRKVQNTCEI